MSTIKATHTPSGPLRSRGGPPPTARYATQAIWPPVTTGHNARCLCTWAWHDGAMRMKYASAMCGEPGHAAAGRG